MKLLVADTKADAVAVCDALDLDPKVWRTAGLHEALGGPAFDAVVVMIFAPDHFRRADQRYIERLQLTLPPGQKVVELP